MSRNSIPLFDFLSGYSAPFGGFGTPLEQSPEKMHRFHTEAKEAKKRLVVGFQKQLSDLESVTKELESIASEMWMQGWDPNKDAINLFTTDFGLVLTSSIVESLGGVIIFRQEEDISHLSIWWQHKHAEAFPFHKIYKRLFKSEGESISFFVDRLRVLLFGPDEIREYNK